MVLNKTLYTSHSLQAIMQIYQRIAYHTGNNKYTIKFRSTNPIYILEGNIYTIIINLIDSLTNRT